MNGFYLTPADYDNPNPTRGYNLFADVYYKRFGLKTVLEKNGQAKIAWERLSDIERGRFDHKASELRKLYKQTHPTPKKPMTSFMLFFTEESKKIREAEGSQSCTVLAKRLSFAWKMMRKEEKEPYEKEARRLKAAYETDLKNQIKVKKPMEFTNWTQCEPTFNAGVGFPWAKILGPDGLGTLEMD